MDISQDGKYIVGTVGVDFGTEEAPAVRLEIVLFELETPLTSPTAQSPEVSPQTPRGYAYPNPAVAPKNPTLRAFVGTADKLEIDIYDSFGERVHSATLQGDPTGKENQEPYYEYVWNGDKESGTYVAIPI